MIEFEGIINTYSFSRCEGLSFTVENIIKNEDELMNLIENNLGNKFKLKIIDEEE